MEHLPVNRTLANETLEYKILNLDPMLQEGVVIIVAN